MATTIEAAPRLFDGERRAEMSQNEILARLQAFGASPLTARFLRSCLVDGPRRQPEEAPRRVQVYRGLTGEVVAEVSCKAKATVLDVKNEILVQAGVPITQQWLCSFETASSLEDDLFVDKVPQSQKLGLQLIVTLPPEASGVRAAWADSSSTDDESASLESNEGAELVSRSQRRAIGKRRRGGKSGRSPLSAGRGKCNTDVFATSEADAPSTATSFVEWRDSRGRPDRGSGGKGASKSPWPSGAEGIGRGYQYSAKGPYYPGDADTLGSSARSHLQGRDRRKQRPNQCQKHFYLSVEMQDTKFHVLDRVKPHAKHIWEQTGVSVRLHGPGSGQDEYERDLTLSLSGKECYRAAFVEAVQLAEAFIQVLKEQYIKFHARRYPERITPELSAIQSVAGYRRGALRA